MSNVILSAEDVQILQWEKSKRENDALYSPMPNGETREKLWKKSWDLNQKISAKIYDHTGSFRNDKRHLLNGNSLDISLLRIIPQITRKQWNDIPSDYKCHIGGKPHCFLGCVEKCGGTVLTEVEITK